MSTTGHESEVVQVQGLKASLKKGGNKGIYNEAICSTAGGTAAKVTNTVPPSFSLTSGATIIVKFTYAISVADATLKVGDADAKPIYYQGAALLANKVKAGTSLLLRYNGTVWNIIGMLGNDSAAAYTPTLSSAPTSSTTTYTKDGETLPFEIGQFCRVADVSMDTGYKFYQLADLSNGVAAWQELGTPLERVTVTVSANANVNALRNAAPTITVRSLKSGSTLLSTQWTGDDINFKVEPGDTYSIEAEDVDGFVTPTTSQPSYDAAYEGTRSFSLTYQTEAVEIHIQSNQQDDATIAALRATVQWTEGGETKTQDNLADGDVVYIPSGTTPTVTFPAAPTGYAKRTSQSGNAYTSIYETELVTVTVTTDDSKSVAGQKITINGVESTLTASGVATQKVAFGTSYSVSVDAKSGYLTPSSLGPYTADQTSRSLSLQYFVYQPGEVTVAPTAKTLSYTGEEQTLINAGEGTGTMMYKLGDGSYSPALPKATGAGEYTVKYKAAANGVYLESEEGTLTVTIAKVVPTYTAPTAKNGLVYTGSAQELLNNGSTQHGAIQYSSDGTTWGTSVPTATAAGASIKVYWRLVGDSNHTDVASTQITCSIAKANLSASVSMASWTYGGTASNPSVSGNSGSGAVTYNYKVKGAADSTYSATKPSNAGDYTVRAQIAESSNYLAGTATTDFTISKANLSASVSMAGWTYGGTASNPSVSGNSGSGSVTYNYKVKGAADSTYSATKPSNAGDYTVRAQIAATSNYNAATVTSDFTIAKAEPSYTAPTAKSLTYTGSPQALLNEGSTQHGTMQYSADGSTWGTSVPTSTAANSSITVYWRIVGDANHKDKASASLTASIAKASRTISFSTSPSEVKVGAEIEVAASPSAGSGDGAVTYSSGDTSKATINGNKVTGVAEGTVTITATVAEGANYLSASTSYTLTVKEDNMVDLGLSVKWAKGNICKDSNGNYYVGEPTDYGAYFSWGNIIGHNEGEGYNFNSSTYNGTPGKSLTGNIASNDASHDAALACLGTGKRMPTKEEYQELYDNCTVTWTSNYNGSGIAGRIFKSKKAGYTDKEIFFPAAGLYSGTSLDRRGSNGLYWSSSYYNSSYAYRLYFSSSYVSPQYDGYRDCGFSVRAVQ